jgi:hypothetical protein
MNRQDAKRIKMKNRTYPIFSEPPLRERKTYLSPSGGEIGWGWFRLTPYAIN